MQAVGFGKVMEVLSIFNVMAAERYRLKAGLWPLFFIVATVAIALAVTWTQAASFRLGAVSPGSASAMFSWVKTLDLVLGVLTCYALLRVPAVSADSNYLRSERDRAVCAVAHLLISLSVIAAMCLFSIAASSVTLAFLEAPFDVPNLSTLLAWVCQTLLTCWLVCLSGLCVGYASHRPGVAAAVVALAAFGVPGNILALPFAACGHEALGLWFSESQPYGWLSVLARGELLDGGALALLLVSCVVLVILILVVCVCRRLK